MQLLVAWMFTLSLGLDTLIVSASLGLRERRQEKARIALVFAAAESVMPIAGLFIGEALGRFFSHAASALGALLLIGVAAYLLFIDRDDGEEAAFLRQSSGWPLVAAAIGISLDEFAAGLSVGFLQTPIALTILLIASQSLLFTLIGMTLGSKLRPYLGEWAEKVSGVVLGLTGVWLLLEDRL